LAPPVDDAVLEELREQGFVDIDYREHRWNIVPIAHGREVVEQHKRIHHTEPVAST
jgi:hypothetical protein